MGIASRILQSFGAPPPESARADIDDELAFHLAERERELVAHGMTPEEARAEALRRFGNLEEVRAECRRIQWGGAVVLQRITLVTLVVLVAAVAWLSYQSVASQRAARGEIEALRAQIVAALEKSGREAQRAKTEELIRDRLSGIPILANRFRVPATEEIFSEEETALEQWRERFREDAANSAPREDLALALRRGCTEKREQEVLSGLWPVLATAQKSQLLDVFVDGNSEDSARHVVHLGATDADTSVAARAFKLLCELAFVRFDVDSRGAYLAWYEANQAKDLSEIAAEQAPLLVGELAQFSTWNETCALYSPLRLHKNLPTVNAFPEHLRAAGALLLVQKWARSDDPRARLAAVQWLGVLEVDEVTARMLMLPLLDDPRPRAPGFTAAACEALQSMQVSWSWQALQAELARTLRRPDVDREELETVARALGEADDSAIPTILAWIVARPSPIVSELLGRHALAPLSGIDYDPFHDATWWLNWWSIHRDEYVPPFDTPTGLPAVD